MMHFIKRTQFHNKEGLFGDPWIIDAIPKMTRASWWKEYGSQTIELQHIATRVLSIASSSGTCERNWAAFDFIHSKRRNRLKPSRAADLVYVFFNMKLVNRSTNVSKLATTKDASSSITTDNLDYLVDDINNEDDDDIELLSDTSGEDEIDDANDALNDD